MSQIQFTVFVYLIFQLSYQNVTSILNGVMPIAGTPYYLTSGSNDCYLETYGSSAAIATRSGLQLLTSAQLGSTYYNWQNWYIAQVPGTSNYVIVNAFSNLALDSMGGFAGAITQQTLTCSSTQQVTLESTGIQGSFYLHMNDGSGDKVLSDYFQSSQCDNITAYPSLTAKNTNSSVMWSFTVNANSAWIPIVANCPTQPVPGIPYYIADATFGCVMESPGSPTQQTTAGNGIMTDQNWGVYSTNYATQNWYIAQVPGTSNYVIINIISNLALDSTGGTVTQQPLTCGPTQQINLEASSPGTFYMHMNPGSGDVVMSDSAQNPQCLNSAYTTLIAKNTSDSTQLWAFAINTGSTWTPVAATCPPPTTTTAPSTTTTTVPTTTEATTLAPTTTAAETTVTTVAETTVTTPPGTPGYGCANITGGPWTLNNQWCFANGVVPSSSLLGLHLSDPTLIDFSTAESQCQQFSTSAHLPFLESSAAWNAFQSVRKYTYFIYSEVWLGCQYIGSSNQVYWTTGTQLSYSYNTLNYPNNYYNNHGGSSSDQYCFSDKYQQSYKHSNNPPSYNWYLTNEGPHYKFICMMNACPVMTSFTTFKLTASATNVEVNDNVNFNLQLSWGQDPSTTYQWQFDQKIAILTTTTPYTTRAFSDLGSGVYNVSVTVQNAVSGPYTVWTVIYVYQKCVLSSVTYPIFATNYFSNIVIQLSSGTNCTTSIDYGDGSTDNFGTVIGDITSCTTAISPCNANNMWLISTAHNYTQPTKHTITVTVTNNITSIVKTYVVAVQTIITGFQVTYPTTYQYIPYGNALTVVFQATTGSHWTFNIWIAATTLTPNWNKTTMNGSVTINTPTDLPSVGPQILYLNVNNTISNQSTTYSFQVEYLFKGFSYKPNPTYLQTSLVYNLTFSFTQASHFNYTITLGNGVQTAANQYNTILWNNNLTLLYNPFTYTAPAIYLVTITVFNHVQTQVYTFNATVQNPVACITYSTSSPGLLAYTLTSSAPVIYTLTFSSICPFPTTAYYNYDYGISGGSLSQVPFLNLPKQNQTYSYYRFGTYNTSVYVYNNISSMNFSLPVIVVVQFEKVTFNISRYRPQIGTEPHPYYVITNETILFETKMSDGSNYNLTWSFGDGQSIVQLPVCFGTGQTNTELSVCSTLLQQNHSYAKEGFYNATIFLQNAAVFQWALLPIPFDPMFIVVQDVIRCFSYRLIEGNQILIPFNNIAGGSWLHLEIFTDPACGLKVGTSPRYIIDWGDGNPWQNNSVNATAFNASANCYDIMLPHNYLMSDIYNLNITIWNEVSHVSFQEVVISYQQIHATGIMTRWVNKTNQETVGYFANATQGYFPLEYPVVFHAQKSFGTFEQYNWTFSDGWDPKSLNDTIVRKFTQHGTVFVSVNMNNDLAAGSFTFKVILERSVANVSLWDNSPWPRNYTSWHEYRLSTGVVPTDACYFLDFNDTDPLAECPYNFYGELSVCQKFFPTYYPTMTCALTQQVNTSYLEGLVSQGHDPNITWNHRFWTLGRKPVQVSVINHVSSVNFIYDTYVTRGPCQFPVPSVRPRNTCTSMEKCRCFQISSQNNNYTCPDTTAMNYGDRVSYVKDNLLIDADTSVNCTSSPQVWFNWTLTQVNVDNSPIADVTTQYLSSSNYYGFNTKILTVGSKQIPPGRYHFVLTVSPSLEIDMEVTDYTYIYIESSPLIAAFGSVDAYYVPQTPSFVFDAWTNSFDPDAVEDPKSNLSFSFYCRRACESWPPPNQMQVYTDWPNYNHSACDVLDGGSYKIAGCFNNPSATYPGPRPLDSSTSSQWKQITTTQGLPGGNITINTQAMTAGQWYSLLVVMNKVADTRVAFQETLFYVNKNQVPGVTFKCITNCQTDTITLPGTSSLRQYRRVNPTSRFSIEAVIDGFALNTSYIYEWDLIARPTGIANLQFDIGSLPLINDTDWLYKATTNKTLRTMSVEENLWNASNNAAGFYFRLNFWIGKDQTAEPMGVYYYEFFLNTPPNPTDGYCKFSRPIGISLDQTFGMYCDNFRDSQSGDLYYYVKQRLDPTSLFWIDSGSSQTSQMLEKIVYISAISGPEELNFNSEFMIRIIDSSGSSIMLDLTGPVQPFDFDSPYYYDPVYSIFNYTESCPGCQLEDFFLTKTKEQKTSEISAIARTFSSMLNKNPSSGCPPIAPCDNSTVNCTAIEMESTTTVAPEATIPSDMQTLIQKHLGPLWTTYGACTLDLKLRVNLRERMTTTFASLQIPYFSSFVQVVSALYPVTLIPQENTIQIMSGVQTCLAKGVASLDGVDPQMNMELEADIREEACTGLISVVSNMERTTNYFGAIWRDQLIKYYPNFNMLGLLSEIQADEGMNFTTVASASGVDIWAMDPNVDVDNETLTQLSEIRRNITLIHIVLDKIYDLKNIITNFVQARKAMGESPSILITENITAIYHKTPTKNMTAFPVVADCGCQFISGDASQMFGNLDSADESVQAGAECGKNNPFTTDVSAKNLTGYTVTMSFQNSTGAIPISGLATPIDAFVPRKLDETTLVPIWNATRPFSQPLLIYRFQMPKFFGLSLLIYDGLRGLPPDNSTDSGNSTNGTDVELTTHTQILSTTKPNVDNNDTTSDGPTIKVLPKFALFIKYWTTFSIASATPYDAVCVLPLMDDIDDNATCSSTPTGNPRMCTVSYNMALKAAASDTKTNGDFVNVFVAVQGIPDGKSLDDFEKTTKIASFADTEFKPVNYTLYPILADCKYYDTNTKQWKNDGTEVGPLTTVETTHCLVSHLTSFSSGFSLPINDLNLEDSGFKHLAENPIAFVFCLCIICLYIILCVWCRRKDKEDLVKAGIAPLPDNDPEDKYLYQIVFYTGTKSNAGTTAKIYFTLTGESEETDPRSAEDLHRAAFRRNGIDTFIMAVPRNLGKLTHLRIWHDNSGKSPSWYFKRMQVLNVQTGEQYFFICDRWLAVEEGDGQVERLLPVAGKNDLTAFDQLFFAKTQKNLFDGHIWFSVFRRPPRSSFTRVQRLTCCLSLIYCTMVANIMFFGTASQQQASAVLVSVGPITITTATFMVAIVSGLVVVPVNTVLVLIFRYARPPPAKTPMKEYEDQMKHHKKVVKKEEKQYKKEIKREAKQQGKNGAAGKANKPSDPAHQENDAEHEEPEAPIPPVEEQQGFKSKHDAPEQPKIVKIDTRAKKKFSLPHWSIYIGYVLAFCTVGVGFWLIVQFAFGFGKAKAITWVIAMFVSLIQSIIFVQPIKILCLALVYSLLCKKPEKDEYEPEEIQLREDEVYMHGMYSVNDLYDPTKRREMKLQLKKSRNVIPPEMQAVKDARERKLKEMAMWALIWEICMYAIFLYTVMMVAYGERDLLAFQTVKNNKAIFVQGRHVIDNVTNPTQFNAIANYADFFNWAQDVFLPGLYPIIQGSNSLPFSSTNKYSTDEQGYLVGTARFRQLRVETNSCKISKTMQHVINHCRAPYSFFDEDTKPYKAKWIPLDPNNTNDVADEYNTWNSMTKLKMQPTMGLVASYWGGGYVADLGNSTSEAYQTVKDLYDNSWLDAFTRAVFVEFSLYYPSINMVCISQLLIEFLPSGSTLTTPVFQVMRLDPYAGPNGIPVMIAEIMCCLFLLYFFYKEVKKLRVEKKKYFFVFWNWMEISVIALSITAVVMFAYRTLIRKSTLAYYKENPNAYNNFAYPLLWEQIYGYMIYIILFIANIKFLRILRFNRRITAIVDTMQYGWQYMVAFFGTFFLIFMAFASASVMLFGNQLLDFMSFINTVESLCVIMMGVFNFEEFHNSSQFFGPLFFIIFIIIIQFILINMFLSIVNDAFAVVKHDLVHKTNDYELMDFVWFKFKNLFCASASIDPQFGEWMYIEEQDNYEQSMDEIRDKFDELVFRLDDFVKDEKAAMPFDDSYLDEDGALKRRTFASD